MRIEHRCFEECASVLLITSIFGFLGWIVGEMAGLVTAAVVALTVMLTGRTLALGSPRSRASQSARAGRRIHLNGQNETGRQPA